MKNKNWWAIAFASLGVGSFLVVGLAIFWHLFGLKSGTMERWAGLPIDSKTIQKVCVRDTIWLVASLPVHYHSEPIAPEECSANARKANFVDVNELNSYYPEANCRDVEGFKVACDKEVELFKMLLADMQ